MGFRSQTAPAIVADDVRSRDKQTSRRKAATSGFDALIRHLTEIRKKRIVMRVT
jgi:hypothetical protein